MTFRIDPVTLEVIRNALTATAEEMSLVVMRSARSPLLREAGDHSSVITDADGFLIAQGRDVPMHMGVMSFTVREFLRLVPKAQLAPGDVWFLNLPEVGGNHLPDVKAIRPVFIEGELAAFAVSLAHWADVGGAVPGATWPTPPMPGRKGCEFPRCGSSPPMARIPRSSASSWPMCAARRNARATSLPRWPQPARPSCACTRSRHSTARRLLQAAMAAIHDRAEAQMRAAITAIPDGEL